MEETDEKCNPAPLPDARPVVPWTGPEILVVLLLSFLCQYAVSQILLNGGWFRWFYGEEFANPLVSAETSAPLARYRVGLWVNCLAGFLQVAVALAFLRSSSGATFADFGLTTRCLGRNLLFGLLLAGIFAPGAYAIQFLVVELVKRLGGIDQPHPFTQLGGQDLHPTEWALLFVAAVVIAPLWEELFYRGIIQPWVQANQPWAGRLILGVALLLTLAIRFDYIQEGFAEGGPRRVLELLPVVLLLPLGAAYLLIDRGKEGQAAGLFATAVLFAWVHVRVWPSPVPLLWLALGLGWLRWRSGSLMGAILLHAVFNTIGCALLVFTVWTR